MRGYRISILKLAVHNSRAWMHTIPFAKAMRLISTDPAFINSNLSSVVAFRERIKTAKGMQMPITDLTLNILLRHEVPIFGKKKDCPVYLPLGKLGLPKCSLDYSHAVILNFMKYRSQRVHKNIFYEKIMNNSDLEYKIMTAVCVMGEKCFDHFLPTEVDKE